MPGEPVAVAGPGLTAAPAGGAAPRVALRALPLAEALEVLAGLRPSAGPPWHPEYPTEDTLTGIGLLVAGHAALGAPTAAVPPWWVHQIVADGVVVGDIGFHGPPHPDGPAAVEIGYQVVPAWWGRGVATAACGLLVELAWRDGAEELWAGADADNVASRRVLTGRGFVVQADGRFLLRRPW